MFTIKNSQLDAFLLPFAKKKRDRIITELIESGVGKVYEEGRHVIVEDSRGNRTTIQFSEDYVPEKVIKPSGIEYGFEYDEEDRLTKFSLPGGERIEWIYKDDLLIGIRLNDVQTSFEYDEERLTMIIYVDGKKTTISYNEEGEISKITDRTGANQTFKTLLRNGRLVYRETDELNRQTEYEIDEAGNLIKIIFPDGSIEQTEWDNELEAEKTKLRNGSERITHYDGPYASSIEYEDGSFVDLYCTSKGVIEKVQNENGVIIYRYDSSGRIKSESFEYTTIHCHYDRDSLLTGLTYPSGLCINYEYDEDQRLQAINVNNQKCEYKYNAETTETIINYPNGITEYHKYNLKGEVRETGVRTKWGENIRVQSFSYDLFSRLSKFSDKDGLSTEKNWQIQYDGQSRITMCMDVASGYTERYEYDAKGNMVKDVDKRVTRGLLDEPLLYGRQQIGYDNAGNIISYIDERRGKIVLQFDNNGLLKQSIIDGEKWNYQYDGINRRIAKGNGLKSYQYTWAGNKIISELYTEKDVSILTEYIYTPFELTPIGFVSDKKQYWFYKDIQGAVCTVLDENGKVVWNANYRAFVEANITINGVYQPWRQYAHMCDEETGIYYSYNLIYLPVQKYYLPSIFAYGFAGGNSYIDNNPLNKIIKQSMQRLLIPTKYTLNNIFKLISFFTNYLPNQKHFEIKKIQTSSVFETIGYENSTRSIDILSRQLFLQDKNMAKIFFSIL